MAIILKGSDVAKTIYNKLITEVNRLKNRGVRPALAIVRAGDSADQISYERSAVKRCNTYGIEAHSVILPNKISTQAAVSAIYELSDDKSVHGILILRPLPEHISNDEIRNALTPDKDIDGITDISLAGVFTGKNHGFAPCTANACIEILNHYKIDCTGKRAVVIGRSLVAGKPVAMMLTEKNATVTICHSKTNDLPTITRSADIIIAAIGKAQCLTGEYFTAGQTVIDVGINWNEKDGKLCGDVKFDETEQIVEAITPVPGGVGTVTTAVLLSNVIKSASRR